MLVVLKTGQKWGFNMDNLPENLTLHFILGSERPKGISEEIYEECKKSFDANRGRFETERDAIKDVLFKYGLAIALDE